MTELSHFIIFFVDFSNLAKCDYLLTLFPFDAVMRQRVDLSLSSP